MDPTTLLTLPARFDPNTRYLDEVVYKKADTAFRLCTHRQDSTDAREQKCSIAATNMIIHVVNELIHSLPEEIIAHHANSEGSLDAATVKKTQEILQQFFVTSLPSSGKADTTATRAEWWKRSQNILRSCYSKDMVFLGQFMPMTLLAPPVKDLIYAKYSAVLYSRLPGSLADAIGCEARRRLETPEELRPLQKVGDVSCQKHGDLRVAPRIVKLALE